MPEKTVVIVGAGPGMGNHIAEVFGTHNFHVVLVARRQDALDRYADELRSKGISVDTQVADAADTASLTRAFEAIKASFGKVDVLVYNAAILTPGFPSELDSDTLVRHYQVDVASALHCANMVLPEQIAQKDGAILFTGGGFALYPMAEYTCVSVGKAALRALAFSMAKELQDKNIFVGVVTIMGTVAPGTHYDPAMIAKKYWELYEKRDATEFVYK